MSKILAEQLLAGIILADNDNKEYIYLPGGEVGSEDPHCVFEKNGERAGDLPLEEARSGGTCQTPAPISGTPSGTWLTGVVMGEIKYSTQIKKG